MREGGTKDISFTRKRFEQHLHEYYRKYGTNNGYILLIDFSKYYDNIRHLLDRGDLEAIDVENAFKTWLGTYDRSLSYHSKNNLIVLYKELFERNKKNGQHTN